MLLRAATAHTSRSAPSHDSALVVRPNQPRPLLPRSRSPRLSMRRLDHPTMKSPPVRRYLPAILIGLVLVVTIALISLYKGTPTVSALKTPGLGGHFCGQLVRFQGKVLLSNPKTSKYLLQDLNEPVTIEIFFGKDALALKTGQVVEVRGIAICKLLGYETAEGRYRIVPTSIVPSYIEEFSHSVIG